MFIKYTPSEGEEQQQFYFQLAKLMSVEAEKIEEITSWSFEEFQQQLMRGSARARRVLLWILLKRQHPTMRLTDINVPVDAITVDFDRDEFDAMLAEFEKARAANPDDASLDRTIAQFTTWRDAAPEPENGPKDPPPAANGA